MILIHLEWFAAFCVVTLAFFIFSALYAYRINAKRASNDPEKEDFPAHFPWHAPFIFPILLLVNVPVFILSSLAFGIFLLLFPFALLLFRKPFLIKWILKEALKIGNMILKIDKALLRAAGFHPTTIKLQVEA